VDRFLEVVLLLLTGFVFGIGLIPGISPTANSVREELLKEGWQKISFEGHDGYTDVQCSIVGCKDCPGFTFKRSKSAK
jgi:hypothetical protein